MKSLRSFEEVAYPFRDETELAEHLGRRLLRYEMKKIVES